MLARSDRMHALPAADPTKSKTLVYGCTEEMPTERGRLSLHKLSKDLGDYLLIWCDELSFRSVEVKPSKGSSHNWRHLLRTIRLKGSVQVITGMVFAAEKSTSWIYGPSRHGSRPMETLIQ